jgi:hypothetical protein
MVDQAAIAQMFCISNGQLLDLLIGQLHVAKM